MSKPTADLGGEGPGCSRPPGRRQAVGRGRHGRRVDLPGRRPDQGQPAAGRPTCGGARGGRGVRKGFEGGPAGEKKHLKHI